MGFDFDIVKDTCELIDRFSIKWLNYYDYSFINLFYKNNNVIDIITYCQEQIDILKKKVYEIEKIEKIKHLEFDEKKRYLINLIENTNNDEDINGLIEKMYEIINQGVEFNHCNVDLLNRFESFILFLEKYPNKCEISF